MIMQTPTTNPHARRPEKAERNGGFSKGTLFHLQVILGVAAVLATLFTAWTPGQFMESPAPQGATLADVPLTNSTQPAVSLPTQPVSNLVGIVAGHWKNDSGAVCPDGLREVDVNLNIASLVQKMLVDRGYTVDLLHEFDPRLEGYDAAALVSIHADSCNFINNEATGFKVAAAFASHNPEFAGRLTACLRNRYAAVTHLPVHSTSVTPDMTLYHAFDEIGDRTPAAIIETGFLNLDRELLTRQPELVAQGIADGILCYLRREPITYPTDTPSSNPQSTTNAPTP
jgi:N-acetylmuramoyl-L-alanine amidase